MARSEDDKWTVLVNNLIKFPSAFGIPPSQIKLTQAFWLLDHDDFDEAIALFLDPLISSSDIAPWQHRAVQVSLLAQQKPKLALRYSTVRKPPQSDNFDVQLKVRRAS